MDFENRIKKEMTEGIVKAILEDAQYRVIDSGIEKVIRELAHLAPMQYAGLAYPDAMRHLPDFTVMNPEQTEKFLVEVKYRSKWDSSLFAEIEEQVKTFGELVLISINSNPPNHKELRLPSTYLRCCRVKYESGRLLLQLKYRDQTKENHYWKPLEEVKEDSLWWGMSELDRVFTRLQNANLDSRKSLDSAIKALSGILN